MVLTRRRERQVCLMTVDLEDGDNARNGKFTVSTK